MGNPQDLIEGAVGLAATGVGLGLMTKAATMSMGMMQNMAPAQQKTKVVYRTRKAPKKKAKKAKKKSRR